jgi:hypothetical protein
MHRSSLFPLIAFGLCTSVCGPLQAQDKPLPENIMAIQDALVWSGDFDGTLDGALGGPALTALKAFQTRENSPAKGRVLSADVKKLAELSAAAKKEAGWSLALDGTNNVVLFVPQKLLPASSTGPDGRSFASHDEQIKLAVFTSRDGLSDLHAAARAKSGRQITRDELGKQRSIVSGVDGERGFYDFATPAKGGAKGFRLSYPASDAQRLKPIANAIANSFVADPDAPLAKKTPRIVPSFIGAYRFDDKERPYPYGSVDVEERQVTIAGEKIVAGLTATDAPPPPDAKPTKRKRRPEPDAAFIPQLTIYAEGKPLFEASAPEWLTHFSDVRIIELDKSNTSPEVMVTSYTDGAHCCTVLTIFTAAADGSWTRVDGGSFDGAPDFPQDLDGDGQFEIVNTDNAFLEAFDSYAASYAPDEIRRLEGTKLVDVSAEEKFRALHRERLGEMWNWGWQSGAVGSQGFLAGFVATAQRTGDGEDAWAFAKDNVVPKKGGPAEPFTDRLKAFLTRENY